MIAIKCKICDREFFTYPSRIKRGDSKYCSKECYHKDHYVKAIKCKYCGKEIRNRGNFRGKVFCNNNCRKNMRKLLAIKRVCPICDSEFYIKKSNAKLGRGKYCSKNCYTESQKNVIKRICLICNKEFYIIPSLLKNKNLGKYCSVKCRSISQQNPDRVIGLKERLRESSEYKKWRKSIFIRDHFTCQKCRKYGGKLNAHHIIPFSIDESLRLDITNGITLCETCHAKEHLRLSKKENVQMSLFEIRR